MICGMPDDQQQERPLVFGSTQEPGEEIQTSAPADSGGTYEPFQYRTLLQVSAALGVPELVDGSLEKPNGIALSPDDADLHNNLGAVLRARPTLRARPLARNDRRLVSLVG